MGSPTLSLLPFESVGLFSFLIAEEGSGVDWLWTALSWACSVSICAERSRSTSVAAPRATASATVSSAAGRTSTV
jgi:hypothetical protein